MKLGDDGFQISLANGILDYAVFLDQRLELLAVNVMFHQGYINEHSVENEEYLILIVDALKN